MVACRPDSILFAGVFVALFASTPRNPAVVSIGVLCLGQYALQSHLSGNYGWVALMHHTFDELRLSFEDFEPTLTLRDYLRIYARAVFGSGNGILWPSLAGCLSLLIIASRQREEFVHEIRLILLLMCFMALHWLVFPIEKDRLLTGALVCLVGVGVMLLCRLRTNSSKL